MKPFDTLTSVAASIDENDIDTDIIFPARFLLLLDKRGLGKHLFHERRNAWPANQSFILDQPPYDKAEIVVAARNFGTGSSREQAVWALADFGIRTVIAESFGEIFYANCIKNGILPVRLPPDELEAVRRHAVAGEQMHVDLPNQTITAPDGFAVSFEIEPFRKEALLGGLDEIGAILTQDLADIEAFEARQRQSAPWLHLSPEKLRFFNDLGEEDAIVRP